jgi:hypothetical protein
MNENYDLENRRRAVEHEEDWGKWVRDAPWIQFPADWKVKIIPPVGGAFVRFRVLLPCGIQKSVYFDTIDRLGCMMQPYWEVYPYQGDCGRCYANDIEELLRMIADETDKDVIFE